MINKTVYGDVESTQSVLLVKQLQWYDDDMMMIVTLQINEQIKFACPTATS